MSTPLTQIELEQVLYIRDELERQAITFGHANELLDPPQIYNPVTLQFYSPVISAKQMFNVIFDELMNRAYARYLGSARVEEQLLKRLGIASCSYGLRGNVRLLAFPFILRGIANALPLESIIRKSIHQDVLSINRYLCNVLTHYRPKFSSNKDHVQYTLTMRLLDQLTQDHSQMATCIQALGAIQELIDHAELEHKDWLIGYNLYLLDFMDAYIKDPSEQIKTLFAYQTLYGHVPNDPFVDVPYLHNRVYGQLLHYAMEYPVSTEEAREQFIQLAHTAITDRAQLKQKYHN